MNEPDGKYRGFSACRMPLAAITKEAGGVADTPGPGTPGFIATVLASAVLPHSDTSRLSRVWLNLKAEFCMRRGDVGEKRGSGSSAVALPIRQAEAWELAKEGFEDLRLVQAP